MAYIAAEASAYSSHCISESSSDADESGLPPFTFYIAEQPLRMHGHTIPFGMYALLEGDAHEAVLHHIKLDRRYVVPSGVLHELEGISVATMGHGLGLTARPSHPDIAPRRVTSSSWPSTAVDSCISS